MRTSATIAALLLSLTLTACTGEGEFEDCEANASCDTPVETGSPLSLPNVSPPPGEEPTSEPPSIEASAAPSAEPVLGFTMPSLVGENLQVAQNRVQEYGVFLSLSEDLLGDREQILDSGWQVCSQTPEAGAAVRGTLRELEGRISFGVVKLSERCPG